MMVFKYPIETFSTIFLALFCLGVYIIGTGSPNQVKKVNIPVFKKDSSTQTESNLKSDKRIEIKNILN
tara:strand:- start:500 stop:703 length:204 start_codon:yes stop_codon:yes gene_type:complete